MRPTEHLAPATIAPLEPAGTSMLSTTNLVIDCANQAVRGRVTGRARWLAVLVIAAACGGTDSAAPADAPAPCVPPSPGSAPTYTELYTTYFAAKMPGHCATSSCHLTAENGWACGLNKDTCYQGMVGVGLINPTVPLASIIADPKSSPLSWINPNGPMPQDTPGPFPEGRDAIKAWVAACAQNN
jgi:hypothetical protein